RGLMGVREAIATYNPVLVVIDPVFAYTEGDPSKGHEARNLTGDLRIIAEQFNCAIILVRHVGKSRGMGDARAAGLYSIEWRAAARSVLLVGADPDNPQKRALTQTKNNNGPFSPAIGYVIEGDPQAASKARFYWSGASDITPEQILKHPGHKAEE